MGETMKIESASAVVLFNGKPLMGVSDLKCEVAHRPAAVPTGMIGNFSGEFTFTIQPEDKPAYQKWLSEIYRLWALKQETDRRWQQFANLYGTPWRSRQRPCFGQGRRQGPRWGQPGRGRKRKARLLARAKEMRAQRRAGKEWNR